MLDHDKELQEQIRKEAIEHRDVLMDIQAIFSQKNGKNFFKYLFKHFNVGEMPETGLQGDMLHEALGLHRAGNSIFKLAAEADPQIAASLLAEIEKERYEELYQAYVNGQNE